MPKIKTPLFYWDACVFLAWLKNEPRDGDQMELLTQVAESLDAGRASLVTSEVTRIEVLDGELSEEAKRIFADIFKRPNFHRSNVDIRIASIAREIRNYYRNQRENQNEPTLTVPDCVHLATAIHYGATLHTFDGIRKKGRPGLLDLSGEIAERWQLEICMPQLPQAMRSNQRSLFNP